MLVFKKRVDRKRLSLAKVKAAFQRSRLSGDAQGIIP